MDTLLTIFNPVTPLTSYDINTEYKSPSYEEDERYNILFSSSTQRPLPTRQSLPVSVGHHKPHLLLHIAIDNDDEDMTRYLLSRGANVSHMISHVTMRHDWILSTGQ